MNKKFTIIFIISLVVTGLIYLLSNLSFSAETEFESFDFLKPQNGLYKVIRVVDGDTMIVRIDGKNETVRLIGINTPESVDPRREVECFGVEASNRAKEILTDKSFKLESDDVVGQRDKYGRLLRYIFLEDGTNFNELMIFEGYAYEYTYDLPYKYQDEFKQAEKNARESKVGLWVDGVCEEFIK